MSTKTSPRPRWIILYLASGKQDRILVDALCQPSEENDWMYVLKRKGETIGRFNQNSVTGWRFDP